jgi:N-acetyl-anhydromuramyl-L-alanine amidase AmpD
MLFSTPPLLIVDRPAATSHLTAGTLRPQVIILHATVGGFTSSLDWLTVNKKSVVSVHRLIDKSGVIYKLAADDQIANHAGGSALWGRHNLNPVALGIEFVNRNDGKDPYPDWQLIAGARQCVEWFGVYGYLPIFGHYQVDIDGDKSDPAGFPWLKFYAQVNRFFARALNGYKEPA